MQRSIVIAIVFITLMVSCDPSARKGSKAGPVENTGGTRLLDTWPPGGPELLWKFEGLGRGYGGPLITREGIFINAEEHGKSYTLCLDHQGKLLWKSPNGREFTGVDFSATYPGTRSTPSIKGKNVYAISGMGHLSCFEKSSGNVTWKVDLVNDFDGIPGDFGYSASPVMDEQNVYCFTGGKEHNLVALDLYTGRLAWSSPLKQDYVSYDTPVLVSLPGREVLAGISRNYIYVADRQDGMLLSSYQLEDIKIGYEHCNSVVYEDGFIYFVSEAEHGQGSVKLYLSEDGTTLKEVWSNTEVKNVFEGFVVVDNYLYTTMENKKLLVLDTEKGRISHSVRAESGSIVYTDNKLIIYGHNGKVQLFSLNNGIPELRSEMRIRDGSGHHFSFPVITNGIMYIRRGNALMAYIVR